MRARPYWHGVDFTATARLAFGLNLQGGTSTGRAVRDNCDVTSALPELLGYRARRFVRRH